MTNELKAQVTATVESLENTVQASVDILSENESILYNGKYYDLIYENYYPIPNLTHLDIPFWLDIASQYGDPILDLSCGTGRVTVPLAEKGFRVTGIDIADSMLEVAKDKSSQVEWIKADIQNFDLKRKFPLILLPANGIWHLFNQEAVEDCFACVRRHLAPGGKFIIDTFNPGTKASLDMLFDSRKNIYSIYPDPQGKGTVVVTSTNEVDLTEQIYKIKFSFKLVGEAQEHLEEKTFRLYFPQELETLLKYNGFKIEKKFGNYDGSLFNSHSVLQIIVCSLPD